MQKPLIVIIDDDALWIKQGKTLLEQAGYEVQGFVVSDPQQFTSESVPNELFPILTKTGVLLVDKDLGQGITSTRFICAVKHEFPNLPVIRWTGGYDDKPYMQYLGVSVIDKPTRRNEAEFVKHFEEKLAEQRLILSGPMGIFAALDETVKPDKYAAEVRTTQLRQISQIAQLADKDVVPQLDDNGLPIRDYQGYPRYWALAGRNSGLTKHELGHCICDGRLSADEIRPYLPALQKVIAKLEAAGEIDERFRICAEFIKSGKLEELKLVKGCY
jgi:hypothetical protein